VAVEGFKLTSGGSQLWTTDGRRSASTGGVVTAYLSSS
jgi:hypothetical protein